MVLLLPFLGTWLWLQGRMECARYDARIQISGPERKDDLVLWKFTHEDSNTQLVWEHAREFRYKGEMYDIVRQRTRGDTTWYWCHHDRKETQVRNTIQSLLASYLGGSPLQQRDQQRIVDFFKSLFTSATTHPELAKLYSSKQVPGYTTHHYPDVFLAPHSPPPEVG